MNKEEIERIKDLKDIFNKKLENFELDKKCGQLSIDSIYSLFPNEIKLLLDYINQLEEDYKNEVEENLKLSELWVKSQEEKRQLETNRDEAYLIVKEIYDARETTGRYPTHYIDDLLEILKRGKE